MTDWLTEWLTYLLYFFTHFLACLVAYLLMHSGKYNSRTTKYQALCEYHPKLKLAILFISSIMWISPKTETCHFVHINTFVILFFHRHNSLQKQSLGIKVTRFIKCMSGHVCELLLTLFSNSNSPNQAMLLYVQTSFGVAMQSVWGMHCQGLLARDKKEQGLLNAFM